MPRTTAIFFSWLSLLAKPAIPADQAVVTDWLKEARIGAFIHFLPANATDLQLVNAFDAEALAQQLHWMGAKYLILTLGQNSGWFNAPNSVYDRITDYTAGERCSKRDLPLVLYNALQKQGIRLLLYLPCQTPNRDPHAQKAFRLPQGQKDQPIDLKFAKQWASVIGEWSIRYGDKVAGWWFDGGYDHVGFNETIAGVYTAAARRGNQRAIVTFNPGVSLKRHTKTEDYTAGELNEPFTFIPSSHWVDGSQWHALTFLGSAWGKRDIRYPDERWRTWIRAVIAQGGVVTLDLGPNLDANSGPIGSIAKAQAEQFRAIAEP